MHGNKSDEKQSGDEEEYDDDINETLNGQPADNFAQLHFNSKTETDTSVVSDTDTTKKHELR